uniref:ABC transporter domain-containing protein n=1 Tax=Meloidogyne incognita TaxID=6306 RepID=A0A914MQQ2_MELIC
MSESQHLLKQQQGDNIEIIEEQQPINYGSLHQQQHSSVKFKIEERENTLPSVFISWHNLTIKHPKTGRIILDNVSGMAKSGQLVALMGASGAGKTTLLNTLLSRNLTNLTVQGKVLVNGEEMGKQITFVSGYVQQDELFMGTLTVKEHLIIQARLRLVGSTERQIKKRVSEILNDLGLHSCRHARIGSRGIKKGISGGEARRLLFACELLSNPQIIFADEPTTGLDSSMAESVINVMKKLAQSGRTVICTIHQPSSTIYRQFDMVSGRDPFDEINSMTC